MLIFQCAIKTMSHHTSNYNKHSKIQFAPYNLLTTGQAHTHSYLHILPFIHTQPVFLHEINQATQLSLDFACIRSMPYIYTVHSYALIQIHSHLLTTYQHYLASGHSFLYVLRSFTKYPYSYSNKNKATPHHTLT